MVVTSTNSSLSELLAVFALSCVCLSFCRKGISAVAIMLFQQLATLVGFFSMDYISPNRNRTTDDNISVSFRIFSL